jgi:gluconolactonase
LVNPPQALGKHHDLHPAGELSWLALPEDRSVTNIAFGGADMRDAYITLSSTGRLVRMRWPEPGLKLAFNA